MKIRALQVNIDPIRCAVIVCLILARSAFAQTPAPQKIVIGWNNIVQMFENRFLERSPDRNASTAAVLTSRLSGFRLNPTVQTRIEKDSNSFDDSTNRVLNTSVTQDSPWGSSVSWQRGIEPNQTMGVSVKQDLLKGGPIYGWSEGKAATLRLEADEIAAQMVHDDAMFSVLTSLADAQSAAIALETSRKSYDRAAKQNKAVERLVHDGYKAKADLLISNADEIRAGLARDEAEDANAKALQALGQKIWQREGDPSFSVNLDPISDSVLQRLAKTSWPVSPPKAAKARADAAADEQKANQAWRDNLPQLSLDGTMTKKLEDTGLNDNGTFTKSVGLTLSMPLVSSITREDYRLARFAAIRSHELAESETRAALDRGQELSRKMTTARRSYEAAQQILRLVTRSLEIQQQQYSDGKITIAELSRSQADVETAENGLIQARNNLLISHLEKAKEAGELSKVLK